MPESTQPNRAQRKAAIALKYDGSTDAAPSVVASGKGVAAEKILETARAHGVPVREDVSLTLALQNVDVGKEIPPELYKAVAEILAFVYRLNGHALVERKDGRS